MAILYSLGHVLILFCEFFSVYFENLVFTAAEPKADNLSACFRSDKSLMFYLLEQTAADWSLGREADGICLTPVFFGGGQLF